MAVQAFRVSPGSRGAILTCFPFKVGDLPAEILASRNAVNLVEVLLKALPMGQTISVELEEMSADNCTRCSVQDCGHRLSAWLDE
jgi:hypothetical protein